jgi:glycosyltransferase 2 family protein
VPQRRFEAGLWLDDDLDRSSWHHQRRLLFQMEVKQRSYRHLANAIAILAAGYFVYHVVLNLDEIPPIAWDASAVLAASLSVMLAVLGIGVAGRIWHLLLRDNGVLISWLSAQGIFAVSQFGKYLPGNVGHHVGRVVMARKAGIPVPIVLSTMIVETIWGAGVAVGLSALALTLFVDVEVLGSFGIGPGILGMGFSVLLVMPWIAVHVINRCFPGLVLRFFRRSAIEIPRFRTALVASALFVCCFLSTGIILKLHAEWIFDIRGVDVLQMTCVFAFAWLAGYVTPGAPGGIGIREAVMAIFIAPSLGIGTAVALGFTLRVTTTLGDAIAFSLGLLLTRARRAV